MACECLRVLSLLTKIQPGAKSIGEMVAILDFDLINYRVLTDKYSKSINQDKLKGVTVYNMVSISKFSFDIQPDIFNNIETR